ncbi:glutamate racemase [Mycobacterium aquaticum]|uniref:glutamate racemase n=1 Tax=Mycobacterium aquaticum TaxID=1927124 RepID=UPI001301C3ED|nr:aspartate/glutamate racemase family protein [Mycobacterium aquaticum]
MNACLGIVDWGVGGVGLVRALDELAPGLDVLYWSDTGVTPYGRMHTGELVARLTAVVTALARRGATEVVLACNAASTVTARLRSVPVPVEGIIGHGVASVPEEIRGPIGVVGGRRTIASGCYRRGLARPGRVVLSRVAQPLSAHIEAGRLGSPQFLADLRGIVAPLRHVQALILACTHYPAATPWFSAVLGDIMLLDPAERFAAAVAQRHPQARGTTRRAARTYLTTGDPDAMRRAAATAWATDLLAARVH